MHHKHSFWRLGVIGKTAISGIEQALWDIFGKGSGQPVWRLLGGKVRDRVRVYTHLGLGDMRAVYETLEPSRWSSVPLAVVDRGYARSRSVFIPYTHYYRPSPRRRQRRAADGGAARGGRRRRSRSWSTSTAGRRPRPRRSPTSRRSRRTGRCLCEEPVQPGDTGALARWRHTIRVPDRRPASGSSTGRSSTTCFVHRAVNIVQPDLCHMRRPPARPSKIAAMAEAVVRRRRAAQPARAARRGRGAALRGLHAELRDPGGDGRRGAVVSTRW